MNPEVVVRCTQWDDFSFGESVWAKRRKKNVGTTKFAWATMKTVFVTVGTTSFDDLIEEITSAEALKVISSWRL